MKGTSFSHTRLITLTPPRITTAVSRVITRPLAHTGTPKVVCTTSLMAWLCTVLPAPRVANTVNTAKITASHFQPRPRSMVYMGPPTTAPCLLRVRYFTASRASPYLVAMPNTPVSQHQSTAPGPPRAMAVDTPMMLPVPMVAARAVASAPNWLISPWAPSSGRRLMRMALPVYRWINRSRTVSSRWVPSSITRMGPFQIKSAHTLIS